MFRYLLFAHYYDNFVTFEDPEAERVCLQKYDKDHDGRLSMNEVLKINESISTSALFYNNHKIRVFKEFSKFVNLTTVDNDIFRSCTNLEEVWFPPSYNRESKLVVEHNL